MNGLSFYICVGKYAGFKKEINKRCLRIVLGWVSIAILFYDFEIQLENIVKKYRKIVLENSKARTTR